MRLKALDQSVEKPYAWWWEMAKKMQHLKYVFKTMLVGLGQFNTVLPLKMVVRKFFKAGP